VSLELLGGWHVAYCYYYCFDIEVFSPLLQSDEVGLAAHDVHVTTPPSLLDGSDGCFRCTPLPQCGDIQHRGSWDRSHILTCHTVWGTYMAGVLIWGAISLCTCLRGTNSFSLHHHLFREGKKEPCPRRLSALPFYAKPSGLLSSIAFGSRQSLVVSRGSPITSSYSLTHVRIPRFRADTAFNLHGVFPIPRRELCQHFKWAPHISEQTPLWSLLILCNFRRRSVLIGITWS
jgi:hypothetical protein